MHGPWHMPNGHPDELYDDGEDEARRIEDESYEAMINDHEPIAALSPPAAEGKEDPELYEPEIADVLDAIAERRDDAAEEWTISLSAGHWRCLAAALRSRTPAPAAEPVAWRYRDAWGVWAYCQALDNASGPNVNTEKQPLYASPPPEPVAISREEVEAALEAKIAEVGGAFLSTAEIVEALSKLSGYPLVEGKQGVMASRADLSRASSSQRLSQAGICRVDLDGDDLDDIAITGDQIAMLRLERMDKGHVWGNVRLQNGRSIRLSFHAKAALSANAEWEG